MRYNPNWSDVQMHVQKDDYSCGNILTARGEMCFRTSFNLSWMIKFPRKWSVGPSPLCPTGEGLEQRVGARGELVSHEFAL